MRAIKQFYMSLTNWLVSFVHTKESNDVLILRLDELGDFILWLDSAKEYRKLYHGKRLTLLVNEKWYDLAKTLPYWDDVVALNTIKFRINPFYRLAWLKFIRQWGFEIVICPRHSVKFTLEPAIVAISGAQQKIVCEGSFPIEKQNYFTRSIPMRPKVHELSRNADFLRGLGRNNFKSTVPCLPFTTSKSFIVICPTSFRKRKEWPYSNFLELTYRIFRYKEEKIIFCSDRKISNEGMLYGHNYSGQTNVMELIGFISQAKLVISNDSAPIHIAAALDVPSVCIGAENLGRFIPYEIEKPREGMVLPKLVYRNDVKRITVNEVWDVVKEMV